MTFTVLDRPNGLSPDIHDDATRREFVVGLGVVGLSAACGGNGDGAADTTTVSTTRTIDHALGTAEVPVRPERVATLSEVVGTHLASVGLTPIAGPDEMVAWLEPYRDVLGDAADLEGFEVIAIGGEPNFEALTRVEPDLIVIETFSEDVYPELSAIAPTVVVDRPTNAAWKQAFDGTVEAAGRAEQAAAVRRRYRDAIAAASGSTGLTITFMRGNDEGSFRIDGPGAFAGSVATEAGFTVDEGGAGGEPNEAGFVEFSAERLDAADGDVIVAPIAPGGISSVEPLKRSPLWQQLPAVTADRVLELPISFYNAGTYVGAELLLRSITDFLS